MPDINITKMSNSNTGADNGVRTRDTKLGKLVLYQLSYVRLKKEQYTFFSYLSRQTKLRGSA